MGANDALRGVSLALLLVLAAAMTGTFRFLSITFSNDHYVHLTAAQQMLFGEWPTRDFIDMGRPLQIAASAAAQRLIGETQFAEAVLVSGGFAVAAVFTAAVAFSITGSVLVALGAVLVEAAAFPRTYAYPRLLATAMGLWLIGSFLRRPTTLRRLMMAGGTTTAFLFRHDLGVFVGVGGLVATLLATPAARWHERARGALAFAAMVLAMVAPYLLYVQMNIGLWNYVETAMSWYREDGPRFIWPNPLVPGQAWDAQLLYAVHLLPAVALGVCAVDWRRGRHTWETRFVASVAVVAVAENFGLIGENLNVRIPDAVVPAVVLSAWLAHRAGLSRSAYVWVPSAVVLIAAGLAVGEMGAVRENLNRGGLTGRIWLEPGLLFERFAGRSAQLHDRFSDPPSSAAKGLPPFFMYLDRCTTTQHRLFLGGFITEVAYLAQRPFAGGGYEDYNFRSLFNQRRVIERLRRQLVPFALIPSDTRGTLERDLPLVAAYLRARYVLLANLPVPQGSSIALLVDSTLRPVSRDAETGWPCFTTTP